MWCNGMHCKCGNVIYSIMLDNFQMRNPGNKELYVNLANIYQISTVCQILSSALARVIFSRSLALLEQIWNYNWCVGSRLMNEYLSQKWAEDLLQTELLLSWPVKFISCWLSLLNFCVLLGFPPVLHYNRLFQYNSSYPDFFSSFRKFLW